MAEMTEANLLQGASRFMEMLLEAEEREGLTLKHWRILQLLDRESHRTCTELVEITGWPPSTVSRLLSELAAHKGRNHPPLISYTENPENRREKFIVKTEAGTVRSQELIGPLGEGLLEKN